MLNLTKLPYKIKIRCTLITLVTQMYFPSTITGAGDANAQASNDNNNTNPAPQQNAALAVVARTMVAQDQTIVPLNAQPGVRSAITVAFPTTSQQCVGNPNHQAKTLMVCHL